MTAAVVLFFAIALVRALLSPAFAPGDLFLPGDGGVSATNQPDVYLVLLDAYPSTESLLSFGYDNRWFEDALAARGFNISRDSHSNYTWTYLVVPTTFHMAHADKVDSLRNPPQTRIGQRRAIRTSLSSTPVGAEFRAHGYHIVSAGFPGSSLQLRDVDEYVGSTGVSLFEHQLLERTALRGVAMPLILEGYRERTLSGLRLLTDASTDPRSTFAYVHVLSPHVPFVFDRQGRIPTLRCTDECSRFRIHVEDSGLSERAFAKAYSDQVDYLNHAMLQVVGQIIDRTPDAIIVLFSDHGSRASQSPDVEWFDTFFAARTPGHPALFPDDARPIEVFPRLFNAYFGEAIPIPEDRSYLSPQENRLPLNLQPIPSGYKALRWCLPGGDAAENRLKPLVSAACPS